MIKIAILGSTGSIGTQTLDIVRKNKDLQVLGHGSRKKYFHAGGTNPGIFSKTGSSRR